jgi:hypothetical protein
MEPRGNDQIVSGKSDGRGRAVLMAASGQLSDRQWAVSRGRRHLAARRPNRQNILSVRTSPTPGVTIAAVRIRTAPSCLICLVGGSRQHRPKSSTLRGLAAGVIALILDIREGPFPNALPDCPASRGR